MTTCVWPLGNGQTLNFTVYDASTTWSTLAGLYIFTYQTPQGWIPLYIGKTENFAARLTNHERWDEAVRRGATHVHALVEPQAATRETWEHLLIQHLQPALNDQLKGPTFLDTLLGRK